ncbi:MAG: hypothetical protein AB7F86_14720 [Bdellovibrionales bacterium]
MLDQYCDYLYSPESLGNIQVGRDNRAHTVLQGETANGFSQVYYRYAKAKISNQWRFPNDLRQALGRYNYFGKLEEFLQRPPRSLMTRAQRLASERTETELDFLWVAAIDETILLRMSRKFPGYHRIPSKLMPFEFSIEARKKRRELISEISKAIWRNDKNWARVESEFVKIREGFVKTISRLDIPDEIRDKWTARIQDVQLVLPGSLPAISNEECSTVTDNAYYYTHLNVITVCAGDFNSEDIAQTLAHELAHAIDIDRDRYLYQVRSEFGQDLASLRNKVCSQNKFSCADWELYKSKFSKRLGSLEGYQPDLPKFQRCLKRRPTRKHLTDSDIERLADRGAARRISHLASNDRFLRITKSEIPLINGKRQKNPNFLNPCSYFLWTQGEEPIDDELTTLLYFTAEFRCQDLPDSERLKVAIEKAKEMTREILAQTLSMEGEFSGRGSLSAEGFSSSPAERFADVVGSYALAERLLSLPTAVDRQNRFLASSSWMCSRPSLASRFPEESAVEREYIFAAHLEGLQREQELFSTPIRQVIGCEKDFEFAECKLTFKAPEEESEVKPQVRLPATSTE